MEEGIEKPVILATGCLKLYQRFISPFFPPSCRFHPTCSEYAFQAVQTHGVLRGSLLAVKRVFRCQPLSKGGFDPVPESQKSDSR